MSILDRLIGLFRNDPERNRKRGAENARRFLAGNPTREEIERYWSDACVDQAFGPDGPDYAEGVKSVLRQARRPFSLDQCENPAKTCYAPSSCSRDGICDYTIPPACDALER